jgi:tetratricopeptide (TPR) repeat protein
VRRWSGWSRPLQVNRLRYAVLLVLTAALYGDGPTVDPGYTHIYNNEFDQALTYFQAQLKADPNDPQNYNHIAQTLLFREMLRDGAMESQMVSGNNPFLRRPKMEISTEEKQHFLGCIQQSISLSDARLQHNPKDVEALFALAAAHGLKSNYLFLVDKSWIDSLKEATAARRETERILQIDPKQVDAYFVIGLDHYIVGSLPFYLRAIGAMGGFTGDRARGIREMEEVREHGTRNRYDAEVMLAVIYRREKDPRKAIPLLQDLAARFPRNYLFRFEQVQMYSDAGNEKAALQVIAEMESLQANKTPGYTDIPPEKIQYTKANLQFWYGDLTPALQNLQEVTRKASALDLNTAVLAWLRLGQVYDLQGKHEDAIQAYRETVRTAPKSEAASEAKGYITNPYHRKSAAG